jgi:hypothetical protein
VNHRLLRIALFVQGVYYGLTGLWGLLHFPSFRAVVGPKPDRFQFHATSVLVTVLGGMFVAAGTRPRPDPLFGLTAVASALALTGVELVHVPRIRKVFLLDMAAEVALAGLNVLGLLLQVGREEPPAAQ